VADRGARAMFATRRLQPDPRDKIHQIPNVISTSLREDMIAMDDALIELVERGRIAFDTAFPHFEDIEKRALLQKRHYRVAPIPEATRLRA
jgi:Tfp pilus assembly pilus retraction ATPase PilT